MKSRVSSFLTKFHTSQRCWTVEKFDKVRVISHFPPSHEPLVILYLVPHFSEVWKCGIEGSWLGKKCDIILTLPDHSTLLRSVELSKEWQKVRDYGKSVTLSWLCQTIPHFYNFEKSGTWNAKGIGLFQTSTLQKRVELRMKKESRDLVASAGHLWSLE